MGVNNRRTPSNKEEQINEQLCQVQQILTDVGTPKEGWRKVEDPGFVTIVRTCNKLCTKAANISSLDEEEAVRLRCTFNQITDILIEIKKIFLDVEPGIFEEEDQAKRYYGSTTTALFSVWTACCDLTVQFADILVQRLWDHSDEHKELLKSISRTSSTCEKLLVLMVDVVKHPLPEGCSISKSAIKGAKCCSQSLETIMSVLTSLPNAHPAEDAILDIITWMLYGLQHVAANAIRPEINTESEEKDDKLFDFSDSLIGLFAVLEDYETGPGLRPDTRKGGERSRPEEGTLQTDDSKTDQNEKDDAKTDKKDNDAKNEQEAAPEKKTQTIHDCIKNLDRLSEEYSRFSETWLLNGKVGVVLDENDEDEITVLFRPEQYQELAKCSVNLVPWQREQNGWMRLICQIAKLWYPISTS
ncbi:hypothetical protein KUTeg_008907 [Tegillarca granosa]|uniref:Uncharacterized protein n=1 Tax=Tegillarca granosa TaxID=220873 RepID=A0ABQ9FAK2_TEGGR|nr:hypothetical protein KUTeg_008907 [Tegillarca granosa]